MSIIYILIPVAIIFTALGIYLFFWAVKTDQFNDLEKEGMSILFDEKKSSKTSETAKKTTVNNKEEKEVITSIATDDKN